MMFYFRFLLVVLLADFNGINSPTLAAEDGIPPKPAQWSTGQPVRVKGKTIW
jgi:hypothetical protein